MLASSKQLVKGQLRRWTPERGHNHTRPFNPRINMLAHNFAFAHLNLTYRDLVNAIIFLAIFSFNTLYWSQKQAASEPWPILGEPTWLDVRAEALDTQDSIRNSSHNHPVSADQSDESISATWSDEELGNSDTSSPPREPSLDNFGSIPHGDDAGDCDWKDILFERPPGSFGFREEEGSKFTDTTLARTPCVEVDLEIGLVKSEPSVAIPSISDPRIPSHGLSRVLKLRSLLDLSTKNKTSIHQPCRRDGRG